MPAGNQHRALPRGPGAPQCAFIDTWHFQGAAGARLVMGMKKNQQKKLLRGEFREFTWGWEHLTLQSCKFEVRLLLAASTWSLLRGQPRCPRPWPLIMGKPKPGVCKRALKWFDTQKGNTVLWTWEECVCCFSTKADACDCPTANKLRGYWFTISSFGLGLAASLTNRCCLASKPGSCHVLI